MPDIIKAAGAIVQNRKVLVERSKGKAFFIPPGGKLEPGETPEQAVIRELKEELQIDVTEADLEPMGVFTAEAANQPGQEVQIHMYIIKDWKGEIAPDNEVDELAWITSAIPEDMKVGSICVHEVIPRLKEKDLID